MDEAGSGVMRRHRKAEQWQGRRGQVRAVTIKFRERARGGARDNEEQSRTEDSRVRAGAGKGR